MYIYLTSGTRDFMEILKKRYEKEAMIVMHSPGNSVLLHETKGKTVFQTPRSYEIIGSSGEITENGFFAMNNIPVTDEGRPIFEHQLLSHTDSINDEPGFLAFRLLRPLNSDTYVVMTEWSSKIFFDSWKSSPTFKATYGDPSSFVGGNQIAHIFSSASYVTTFTAKTDDDDNEEEEL